MAEMPGFIHGRRKEDLVRIIRLWICFLFMGLVALANSYQQGKEPPKITPVSIAVESEGPNGLWVQSVIDLTNPQLQKLEQMVRTQIAGIQNVRIVDAKDSEDHLHITVVGGRVPRPGGGSWFVVSSVVTLAKAEGIDLLATHDVIAGPDLSSVAKSVVFQFLSMKLRFSLGMLK